MKPLILLFGIGTSLISCSQTPDSQTESDTVVKDEFNLDLWLDSVEQAEQIIINDPTKPEYYLNKAQNFMMEAFSGTDSTNINRSLLDSTLINYKIAIEKGTKEPIQVFYCGLLSEKLGDSQDGAKYYKRSIELANWNINNAESTVKSEVDFWIKTSPNQDIDSLKTEIINSFIIRQNFSIALAELMLGENESGLKKLSEIKKKHPEALSMFSMFLGNINTREDILNWIDIEE